MGIDANKIKSYKYDGVGRVMYLQERGDTTNYIYEKNGNIEKVVMKRLLQIIALTMMQVVKSKKKKA